MAAVIGHTNHHFGGNHHNHGMSMMNTSGNCRTAHYNHHQGHHHSNGHDITASNAVGHAADCRLITRVRSNSDTCVPNLVALRASSSSNALSSLAMDDYSYDGAATSHTNNGSTNVSYKATSLALPPLSLSIANARTSSTPSRGMHHGGAFCGHARQAFYNLRCGCLFSFIPDEILLFNVFTFFDHQLLASISAVCKRWKFISGDNLLWSQLDLSPFARRLHDHALMSYITRFGTHVQTLKLCQSKRVSAKSLTMMAEQLPNVRDLHLCNVRAVDDQCLINLAEHCQYLERLSIIGCTQVTNNGLSAILRHCTSLRDLTIRGCTAITNDAFTIIAAGVSLTSLNIAGCHRINGDGLIHIVRQCHQLQRLNAHAIKLTDNHMDSIARILSPSLLAFDASNANPFGLSSNLTDLALQYLSRCHHLESINLSGAGRLTDGGISFLLSSCASLQRIDLSGCIRLTDRGIAKMVRCPSLQQVNVAMCDITDDTVRLLMRSLPLLTHMDVHECDRLTDGVITPLLASHNIAASLTHMDMASCRNITSDIVHKLRLQRPSLNITH